MPVLGRRPAVTQLLSGDSLLIVSEALQYTLPAFTVKTNASDSSPYLKQDHIIPLGTRVCSSLTGDHPVPVPVLCLYKNAGRGAQPLSTIPLQNAIDPTITLDPTTKKIHMLWWWNGWTGGSPLPALDFSTTTTTTTTTTTPAPTFNLPRPPGNYWDSHSVPDPLTPPWLRSLVPKSQVPVFNSRQQFWIAPIAEGYQYDYFNGITIGESRSNGPVRLPDTPGARQLQDLIRRGLVSYPGPLEAPFGAGPSSERDDWERRGGIVAAGEHVQIASQRDTPEFIPVAGQNPYTHEFEMEFLPGIGTPLPATTTWQDHLIIINALKAHYDHANLINSTRVLMYSSGFLLDSCELTTVPRQFLVKDQVGQITFQGGFFPSESESTQTSLLLLDFPQVVASFPVTTNYRTSINPDKFHHPYLDYPDIGSLIFNDGFLVDGPTNHPAHHPAVDWVVSDPTDLAAQFLDMYRNHLDNKSY